MLLSRLRATPPIPVPLFCRLMDRGAAIFNAAPDSHAGTDMPSVVCTNAARSLLRDSGKFPPLSSTPPLPATPCPAATSSPYGPIPMVGTDWDAMMPALEKSLTVVATERIEPSPTGWAPHVGRSSRSISSAKSSKMLCGQRYVSEAGQELTFAGQPDPMAVQLQT